MEENQVINITLADNIILESDPAGNELLRLGIKAQDKETREDVTVIIAFPAYGKYDSFVAKTAELLGILALGIDNLMLPNNIEELQSDYTNTEEYKRYAYLMSIALKPKQVRERVENLFFNYLFDYIEGINLEEKVTQKLHELKEQKPERKMPSRTRLRAYFAKKWARENLDINLLVHLFTIIVNVDELIKKKTRKILETIFQPQTKPQSQTTFAKNSDITSEKYKTFQSSKRAII